ncbi:DUF6226 family protein [Microterricola gilva]|nr:DUF6226 family protein [Microterricola gilva]
MTLRYQRPALPSAVFLDAGGRPIPYGSRWGVDGPPENSYGVSVHPERFAGLHTVAHSLIAHLDREYDVEVRHESAAGAATELLHAQRGVLEIVRVIPRDPEGAPLLIALTAYPGVILNAGILHEFPFPFCGCEACDESVEGTASELEELVLAVAAGGFTERYPVGPRRELHLRLVTVDPAGAIAGSRIGGDTPTGISAERLAHGAAVLNELPRGWQPWPLRKRAPA